MPWMEFEPTIPAFERAKTVHALDRAATVIGLPTVYVVFFSRALFNDVFQHRDYIASNCMVIDEWRWIGKYFEGSGGGLMPTFACRDWGQPRRTFHNSRCPTRDSNRVLPNTNLEHYCIFEALDKYSSFANWLSFSQEGLFRQVFL
jgi:hypothetical protein